MQSIKEKQQSLQSDTKSQSTTIFRESYANKLKSTQGNLRLSKSIEMSPTKAKPVYEYPETNTSLMRRKRAQ